VRGRAFAPLSAGGQTPVDLFYYGSQDIPPPLGTSGYRRGESEGGVCEACNAPVTPEELAEGKATEIYGVVLCASCGGDDEALLSNRVELYFCDRCHVSVPVYRVDTGEALSGDGRILCLDCRAGPHRRSTSRLVVVATVALILVGAGFLAAAGIGSNRPAGPDHGDILNSLDDRLSGLAERLGDRRSREAVARILRDLEALDSSADDRAGRLADAIRHLDRLRDEFELRMRDLEGSTGHLHEQLDELLLDAAPGGD